MKIFSYLSDYLCAPFQLAKVNLRRKKNSSFSFAVIVLLAVALLDTGLSFIQRLPNYFIESNERLNGPHYVVRITNNDYLEAYSRFFETDPRVSNTETAEIVMMDNATYSMDSGEVFILGNFLNVSHPRSILPMQLTGSTADVPEGKGIYVPIMMQEQGIQLGDTLAFDYKKREYSYQVAGFFETTWFGTMVSSMINFYLDDTAYKDLYREVGGGKWISVQLHDPAMIPALEDDYKASTGIVLDAPGLDTQNSAITIETMRSAITMIPYLLSALFASFSIIILIIAMLIIRFRISNYIQDNMQNIGALQALGYRSGQVRGALTIECILSGAIGGIFGIFGSYALQTLLGGLISAVLGVRWMDSPHIAYDLISLIIILAAVGYTALLSTRKIRRLPPVMALRMGAATHSFRRNILPLDGPLSWLEMKLACKSVAANLRQYTMIGIILFGITFASAFSILMYQNIAADLTKFIQLLGEEKCDVSVTLSAHTQPDKIRELLEGMQGVESTAIYDSSSVAVNGELVSAILSDDFTSLHTASVYEGTFPREKNEVVLTGRMAGLLHKEVGDTVTLEYAGVEAEYIVCGLNQTGNGMGRQCALTLDGMKRVNPSYWVKRINIYLLAGWDPQEFILNLEQSGIVLNCSSDTQAAWSAKERIQRKAEEKLKNLLSMYRVDSVQYALMDENGLFLSGDTSTYLIDTVSDANLQLQTSFGIYASLTAILAFGLLLLCAIVALLILHLVVKSTIIRRKREFGIYQALGYTSPQIMRLIAFSFLPVSIPGILIGCISGGLLTGPILSNILSAMGISQIDIIPSPFVLLLLGTVILLSTYLTALYTARRIKKISVYDLFTE